MEQELTFHSAQKAFERYGVEFGEGKYRALAIRDTSDELFTNLALILSNQCAHTTKIAVFADRSNTQFRDSKEFGGSIFAQLDDAYSYLMLCNRNLATFKGLERIERPDYPEEALREALLNALIHRDYSFSGSIIINVNDYEIEFISIGGLPPGLSPDDIRAGISQPRNKNLAEVFHRLRLIESYGTGVRKIYRLYSECSEQPRIEVTPNTFKIVLPNMNMTAEQKTPSETPKRQQKMVLDYIEKHGAITESEIQELFGVKRTRAYMIAKQMCEEGLIAAVGRGKDKKYVSL